MKQVVQDYALAARVKKVRRTAKDGDMGVCVCVESVICECASGSQGARGKRKASQDRGWRVGVVR